MEMRYYLAIFLTVSILSSTEASKAAGKVKIKSRSPVYFPVIPIGNFDVDFGSRVAESISHSRRIPSSNAADISPLVSVLKVTTTTEKLPLAQESHVASNSITEAPGPAYLTDSIYYIGGGTTPDPSEVEDYDHGYINIRDLQDSSEGGDREREDLGVYLQSILSYEPPLLSKNRDNFDHLINPAKMHFIPPNSGEVEEEGYAVKDDEPQSTFISSSNNVTSESAEYDPPQATSFYEVPQHNASPVIKTKTSYQSPPIISSVRHIERVPDIYRAPILVTIAPVIRYEAPTRAPRVVRIKPASSKRVQSPFTAVQSNAQTSSTSQSLFVKSSDLFMPIPAASFQTSSGTLSRSPSSRYLPKPASNPFAARISQPVVKPVYGSEDKVEISNFPANRKHSSWTELSPVAAETSYRSQLADAPKRSTQSIGNESFGKKNFGERKTKIDKTVEIYAPPTSLEDQNILFESKKRDYGFGFNSASGSVPRRHYKAPSVTLTPILEAPVYRTSTKSYRAPSSLFQAKETVGKPVTAPSQPEFIQTDANIYVPQEYDENAIPGVGGVDYPNFDSIPSTDFKCSAQEHPGLYADQDTKCQVFHICQEGGREDSFLCPNGTVFNQQYFVCDWWYNFSCESADRFYSLNALIYELPASTKYYS